MKEFKRSKELEVLERKEQEKNWSYDTYQIVERNVPRIFTPYVVFYFLECMICSIQKNLHEIEVEEERYSFALHKLLDDIIAYQTYVMDKLARMIYDYSVRAILGELRHIPKCAYYCWHTKNNSGILDLEFSDFGDFDSKKYRNYRDSEFRQYLYRTCGGYSDTSILNFALYIFGTKDVYWRSSFGGHAWETIAKAQTMYGKLPNKVYIDHCADLQHNCGTYFDKEVGIFTLDSKSDMTNMLDYKREFSPYAFLKKYYTHVDSVSNKLFVRYMDVFFDIMRSIFAEDRYEIRRVFSYARDSYGFHRNICKEYDSQHFNGYQENLDMYLLQHYIPYEFGKKTLSIDIIRCDITDDIQHKKTYNSLKNPVFKPL